MFVVGADLSPSDTLCRSGFGVGGRHIGRRQGEHRPHYATMSESNPGWYHTPQQADPPSAERDGGAPWGPAGVASSSGGGEGGAAGQGAAQGQEGEYTAAEWAEWNEWVRATEERFSALRGQLEARTRDMVEVTKMGGRCEGRS